MRFLGFAITSIVLGAVPSMHVRAEEPDDQRVRFLISALDRRMTVDKEVMPLTELLNSIMTHGSEPAPAKDAKKRFTVIIDEGRIKSELQGMFDLERHEVHFDSKLENVRLDRLLRIASAQTCDGGVFLIRSDYVEIVTRTRACQELKLTLTEDPRCRF